MNQADQVIITVPSNELSPVASPCIDICRLDDDMCLGCYRTIEETVNWATLDNYEKTVIIEQSNMRKKSLNKS